MNFINQTAKFLTESKNELLKVVWPKKEEVVRHTAIVILTIIIATLIIAVFDIFLIKLVQIFVLKGAK